MTNIAGNYHKGNVTQQGDLFDEETQARTLLDGLLQDSKLYTKSESYHDLMDFVVRLRNFAPFNVLLLQIQKPGLTYAASALDWREKFNRTPKEDARPLLILWPFGPVALVYDVLDTEGEELPEDVASFPTSGVIEKARINRFAELLGKNDIELKTFDLGDGNAGYIKVAGILNNTGTPYYQIKINQNHSPAVQFVTLTHELAHLYLGHLGANSSVNISDRHKVEHEKREIEAESVAYIVCKREGITPKSEVYLSNLVNKASKASDLDLYQIMRAAGQVEKILGLARHTKFGR